MRILKSNVILRGINSNIYDSRISSNINYFYNLGALLGIGMIMQIISGIILSMYYIGDIEFSYKSIWYIMIEIMYCNIIRGILSNGVSLIFIMLYLHMIRGLNNGSYIIPRVNLFNSGVIIFLLMIIISFLGYSLVCGIQSYWAIVVITNLLSSIPYIGKEIVILLWSGYSPSSLTIKRFYSLLYLLPFILLGLIIILIIFLLEYNGTNTIGIRNNTSIINFHSYLTIKDIFVLIVYILILLLISIIYKNRLLDLENNIEFDSLKTPNAIIPLWYLLTFYAILRAIPNKLLGVILMILSILILMILTVNNTSLIRLSNLRLFYKAILFNLFFIFLILLKLGSKLPSYPYDILSLLFSLLYFFIIIIIIPLFSIIDNFILFYI